MLCCRHIRTATITCSFIINQLWLWLLTFLSDYIFNDWLHTSIHKSLKHAITESTSSVNKRTAAHQRATLSTAGPPLAHSRYATQNVNMSIKNRFLRLEGWVSIVAADNQTDVSSNCQSSVDSKIYLPFQHMKASRIKALVNKTFKKSQEPTVSLISLHT